MFAPQETRYYVDDEIIITGDQNVIDDIIANLREDQRTRGLEIEPVERLALEMPSKFRMECEEKIPDITLDGRFVIDKYRIHGESDIAEIIEVIQEIAGDQPVRPEPNYVTGRSPVKGDPWSIAGDPWSIAGDPWSIAGDPWSIAGDLSGQDVIGIANEAFSKQWAFGPDGIKLVDVAQKQPNRGMGVRIGIFDTSPFPVTMDSAVFSMEPPLRLTLEHPMQGGWLEGNREAGEVRNHGLFVAGLAHAVAPGSDIHLIRVLDDSAQGDLQTLNGALLDFILETLELRAAEKIDGAVINLSLGVYPPPEGEEENLPKEITSLNTILSLAQCLDIVTVAASGNDSMDLNEPPLTAQIPASFPSTIGVAASNKNRELSCFSNLGEVMAPGGDGDAKECKPAIHLCIEGEEDGCEFALISLSLASNTGYGYWTGTSFSAPLVSGLAAAITESQGGWMSTDEVRAHMEGFVTPSADPGLTMGIINVKESLP
jgi:hypothetical protein